MNFLNVIAHPPAEISIDVETTGLERTDKIVTFSVAWSADEAISLWIYGTSPEAYRNRLLFKKLLDATLFNPKYQGTVIFHNVAFDMYMIFLEFKSTYRFSEREICKVFDTMAASRVLRNNKLESHADPEKLRPHSLKFLAKEHFGENHSTFENALKGRPMGLSHLAVRV